MPAQKVLINDPMYCNIKLPKLEGLIKLVNQGWDVRKRAWESFKKHDSDHEKMSVDFNTYQDQITCLYKKRAMNKREKKQERKAATHSGKL